MDVHCSSFRYYMETTKIKVLKVCPFIKWYKWYKVVLVVVYFLRQLLVLCNHLSLLSVIKKSYKLRLLIWSSPVLTSATRWLVGVTQAQILSWRRRARSKRLRSACLRAVVEHCRKLHLKVKIMPRVYIGRLSYHVREKDIQRFFSGYGKLMEIDLKNGWVVGGCANAS